MFIAQGEIDFYAESIVNVPTGVPEMKRMLCSHLLLATAAMTLAACGGGGGGSNLAPPPPPAPTPPPPPPPSVPGTPVTIFPAITETTDFATLGYQLDGNSIVGDGFSVRYDAGSKLYMFDLPSAAPGGFYATSDSDASWSGGLAEGNSADLWPPMSVLKPSATNPEIQLSYTSFASYLRSGPMWDLPHGIVVFGIASPASAVPVTGQATMNAEVAGFSVNGPNEIDGTATLEFNFAAGTLAGHFDPMIDLEGEFSQSLGRYTFVDTVHGVGSPSFSGQFSHSDPRLGGTFSGLFTGPNAEELMARWTGSFFVEGVTANPEQMFGVWVGRK